MDAPHICRNLADRVLASDGFNGHTGLELGSVCMSLHGLLHFAGLTLPLRCCGAIQCTTIPKTNIWHFAGLRLQRAW